MPKKPRSPCRYTGCHKLSETTYCKNHQTLVNKNYNKYTRNPETNKRYGATWRKIRNIYINKNPLCEVCDSRNKIRFSEEVHHIKPLGQGGTHSEDNLMSLCKSCHSRITATEGGRFG